jgi:hypothetical protein
MHGITIFLIATIVMYLAKLDNNSGFPNKVLFWYQMGFYMIISQLSVNLEKFPLGVIQQLHGPILTQF